MARISYSQYSLYKNCPKQYKLRYYDKLSTFTNNIHLIFGKAMHTTIQTWLDCIYKESIKKAEAIDLYTMLKEELVKEFIDAEAKDKQVPCTREDIEKFYLDGVEILKFLSKKRADYFGKRGWTLVGCEIPINVEVRKNVRLVGFLDVVLKSDTGQYRIIDLKTSTMGWNKFVKKDKVKAAQLLFYKMFFGQQRSVNVDDIDIEFMILKRQLYEKAEFPQKRIQIFKPANGSVSMNRARNDLLDFVNTVFDDEGKFIVENMIATPSKKACRYCEFLKTDDCTEGIC